MIKKQEKVKWKARKTDWLGKETIMRSFTKQVDPSLSIIDEKRFEKLITAIQENATSNGHSVSHGWTVANGAAGLSCSRCRKGTFLRIVNDEIEVRGKFYTKGCRK